MLPAFNEEDEKANAAATANVNVSSSVGVLKMHSSSMVPTHKIQIQANGSPQIIASPDGMSGSSSQVCLDPAGYNSDVDVRRHCTTPIDVVTFSIIIFLLYLFLFHLFIYIQKHRVSCRYLNFALYLNKIIVNRSVAFVGLSCLRNVI